MGRIIQLQDTKALIPLEKRPLKINHWQFIEVINSDVKICLNESVFLIKDITLDDVNKINHENKDSKHFFNFEMAKLACPRCGGTGIIDWIDKATKTKAHPPRGLRQRQNHIRDKKGKVTIFHSWSGYRLYVSSPKMSLGDEVCYKCYGSGIKLDDLYAVFDVVTFDQC